MRVDKEEKSRQRRLRFFFIFAVFLVLAGTLGLLGGALYILMSAGILHFEMTTIQPWFLILIMLLSSITIGLTISLFLSKFVFKTADTISRAMMQLAKGDYDVRIDLGKNEEFQHLAESFNKLAEELKNTKMLRSNFINEFAHEFKTPIVSLKGFAELLAQGNLTEEQKKEYLDIILEETKRLSLLSTNMLNLSKIEKQNILTDVTKFNVSEQIRSCVLLLENKWTQKNLDLNMEFSEYSVEANEDQLKQVWINLIDNAIKFSNVNGVLEISILDEVDGITIKIKNQGIKLKEEEKEKIFEKFYRADNSHSIEGNGVGLTIVKKTLDLHGGKIWVENEGDFTVFSVKLFNVKKIK